MRGPRSATNLSFHSTSITLESSIGYARQAVFMSSGLMVHQAALVVIHVLPEQVYNCSEIAIFTRR